MLRLREDALEEAMVALMELSLGDAVHGVATAVTYLVSEQRREREEAALHQLRHADAIQELGEGTTEEASASVGVPQEAPHPEPLAPPAGPIPLGATPRTREARTARDASTQTGLSEVAADPTWEEVRSLLIQVRSLDSGARTMRDGAFEALERYSAFHPEPNAAVDVWRRRVAAKLEEVAHLEQWLAERRERQREEHQEEERLARARSEAAGTKSARPKRRLPSPRGWCRRQATPRGHPAPAGPDTAPSAAGLASESHASVPASPNIPRSPRVTLRPRCVAQWEKMDKIIVTTQFSTKRHQNWYTYSEDTTEQPLTAKIMFLYS